MQIESQEFLPIVEQAGALCFFDIECTGTHGDYNSVLVVSVKPYHKRPVSFVVERAGDDRRVVRAARDELSKYLVWVSYFGSGFDVPLLQSRLLRHRANRLEKKHHIDMYYHLNSRVLTSRRSQAHRLEWLESPQHKMTLSAELWNKVLSNPRALRIMLARCESDCRGLEWLYDRTKHLIINVTK